LLCCRYLVAFRKVLIIHDSWILPLHHSPLFLLCIPGITSKSLIFPFSYIVFPLHSPSYILSLYALRPPLYLFTFLFSVFEKKTFLFV
jgi:hypothetical protein